MWRVLFIYAIINLWVMNMEIKYREHAKFIIMDYVIFSILTFGSLGLAIYFIISAIQLEMYGIIGFSVFIIVFFTYRALLSLLHTFFWKISISNLQDEITYFTPFMIKKKIKVDNLIIKFIKSGNGYLYYAYDGDKKICGFGHEWNSIQELLEDKGISTEEITVLKKS